MSPNKHLDVQELSDALKAMLQLLEWQEQLVCSAMDILSGQAKRAGPRKAPRGKRKIGKRT